MTTFVNFLLGYFGSLLATLTGVAISLAIVKLLIPWYQAVTYQGVKISGTWVMTTNPAHPRFITWEIEQRAAKISGISTHVASTPGVGGDKVRTYRLEGKITNRFLTVTGYPTDSRRMGCICYLFEIVGDGTKMTGWGCAYSTRELTMIGGECTLTRKEETTAISAS